jgi:hypothetical protein
VRSHGRHELDSATGSGEWQRPKGILSCQSNHITQFGGKKPLSAKTIGSLLDDIDSLSAFILDIILNWT